MPSDLDLRSLDAEPPTPSRVDVERAIADGRRRRTRRGVAYAGAATLTVVAVVGASVAAAGLFTDTSPTPDATDTPIASGAPEPADTIPGVAGWQPPAASPPTSCTLERLPVPDGVPMALTSGADPTGRYIVGRTYPGGAGYKSVIWQDGQPTDVDLPGDVEESLEDVNSAGTAVGWSYADGVSTENDPVPYVYRDGQVSPLPGVPNGYANAINEAGAIAGDAAGAPVVWPSATEEPVRLPLPDGAREARVTGIDEDGTVVGTVDDGRPYVWFADGTHRELQVPAVEGEPAMRGRVFHIRNGVATGLAVAGGDNGVPGSEGAVEPVRWDVRTGEARVVDALDGPADALNAQGWMAGIDDAGRAVLITDAGTVELPALADHEPGGLTNIPSTMSDDGRVITGQSDDETGTIQAVLWRCQ